MTQAQINAERLANIQDLSAGSHPENDGKNLCVMEAVAYVAGEPWSDRPVCASPVIGAFMRSWNDGLSDDDRNRLLKPLIPRMVNTRGSDAVENHRAYMASDWLIRVNTPAWFRLAKLDEHAGALAGLPEIMDVASAKAARPTIDKAARAAEAAWNAWNAGAAGAAWAAWDAAGTALKPTVEQLQLSAIALIERMIAAGETT